MGAISRAQHRVCPDGWPDSGAEGMVAREYLKCMGERLSSLEDIKVAGDGDQLREHLPTIYEALDAN